MASIEVIATPKGEAPEWVLEALVGLVLPLPEQLPGGDQCGLLGGPPQAFNGYQVEIGQFLVLLHLKNQEASDWFRGHVKLADRLVFEKEVCRLIP